MQPWATSAERWRKREKSTQRILICMWMSINKNVWHIAKDSSWRWQVGGGTKKFVLTTTKWCLCGGTSGCVCACFALVNRRASTKWKEFRKWKEGLWESGWNVLCRRVKRNQSFGRFGHEYNYNQIYCQAHVAQNRTSQPGRVSFLYTFVFCVRIQDKPSPLFLSSLFFHTAFNRVGFSVAWTYPSPALLYLLRRSSSPYWITTNKENEPFFYFCFISTLCIKAF